MRIKVAKKELPLSGLYYIPLNWLCFPAAVKIGFWCENNRCLTGELTRVSAPMGMSDKSLPSEFTSAHLCSVSVYLLAINPSLLFHIKYCSPHLPAKSPPPYMWQGWIDSPRVCVLVGQWCPTLCNPMNCSLPGSSVHGILQARILEQVAISFSRGSSWLRDWTWVSCIASRCFNIWATREAPRFTKLAANCVGFFVCVCVTTKAGSDDLQKAKSLYLCNRMSWRPWSPPLMNKDALAFANHFPESF